MSLRSKYYVVLGYDLTDIRYDVYTQEWAENPENEHWEDNLNKGEIKLFSDPYSGDYLIFGYIQSVTDEGDYQKEAVTIGDMERQKRYVDYKLKETGLNVPDGLYFKVIAFCEQR